VIYAALKKYERSLYCFEVALTTPSSAVSHIMLETYKKYILVSLILHGKVGNCYIYSIHGLLCVIVTVPVIDNCAPQVHFSGGQPVAQAHEFRLS